MTSEQIKQERKDMMKEVARKRSIVKDAPITVQQYEDYKAKGHSDAKIMKHVKMHNAGFNEWKHAAGLIGQKVEQPKKIVDSATEEATGTATELTLEDKASFDNSSEIEELKEQIKEMQLDHNQTLRDYGALQNSHQVALDELKELSMKHNNEAVGREEAEENLLNSKRANQALAKEVDSMKIRLIELENVKTLESQEQAYSQDAEKAYRDLKCRFHALEEELTTLRDAEDLSVALARRYVALSQAVTE